MLKSLFTFIFGPSSEIPPAASSHEGGDADWHEREHNRRLNGVVSKSKVEAIRQVDLRSKAKYDSMDVHIRQLRELKDKLCAKKLAKRAARVAAAADPEPA